MTLADGPHRTLDRLRDPDARRRQLRTASIIHLDGDLRAARKLYETILDEHPDDATALTNLGLLLQQLGETDEAVELLERATVAPDTPRAATTNLALAYIQRGEIERGAAMLEEQADADPATGPWMPLSKARLLLHDVAGATAAARRAVEQQPSGADRWRHLGACAAATGDLDLAIDSFDRATSLDPMHPGGWRQLGAALLARRDLGSARAATQQACGFAPAEASAWKQLAIIELALGNHGAAAVALDRALELDPVGSVVDRAILHLGQDDPAAALALLDSVGPTDETRGRHELYRAMAYLAVDDTAAAAETLARIDPTSVHGDDARLLLEQIGAGR